MHFDAYMSDRPVSMKEIARLAGVTQPTVSRALRNHASIPSDTTQRIQRIANELGYKPNPFVSTLMADLKAKRKPSSTCTLAYVTTHLRQDKRQFHPTFINFFEGAKERAASLGYVLEHFHLKDPGMTSEKFTRMLYTRDIQGVLIPPLPRSFGHLSLDWSKFAAVTIGYTLAGPNLSRAANNHYLSILLALRNLQHLGYKRIGLAIENITCESVHNTWLAGYLVFQHSLPPERRVEPYLTATWTNKSLSKWIRNNKLDAVVGAYNEVMPWFTGVGLKIPEKVGFASLSTGFTAGDPAGINHHPRLVGAAAVDLIIGQLHRNERGVPSHPKLLLIPGSWVDGPTVRRIR